MLTENIYTFADLPVELYGEIAGYLVDPIDRNRFRRINKTASTLHLDSEDDIKMELTAIGKKRITDLTPSKEQRLWYELIIIQRPPTLYQN